MFTVALVGADGSGKTTVCQEVLAAAPSIYYVYMGVNPEAATIMLPTTRLWMYLKKKSGRQTHQGGPPVLMDHSQRSRKLGVLAQLKSLARLLLVMPEEMYRSAVVNRMRQADAVVLLDRDYYLDYYWHDVSPNHGQRSLAQKIHGWYLSRFYRQPDMVLHLDAPAEILFARKQEGSIESIESRRMEYCRLAGILGDYRVIDVKQPLEDVVAAVMCEIDNKRREVSALR